MIHRIQKNKKQIYLKYIIKTLMFLFIYIDLIYLFPCNNVYSIKKTNDIEDSKLNNIDNIIENQKDTLGISEFIKETQKYSKNVFDDIDFEGVLKDAIKGDIDNYSFIQRIINLFLKEMVSTIKIIISIAIIVIIHSLIKSITDGLENKSIGEVTYYVQYILIVTLVMSNFSEMIEMVRNSIINLINFSNCLIPLLITLVTTTGNIISANIVQPIILILITFIGNFINIFVIPIILVSTVLNVVSKLSDRIQLNKLSKYLKSSTIWILGIILTVFVGTLSLEGTIGSTVDGITVKTTKAAVTSFVPIVGKILGDAVDTVIGCTAILKDGIGIVGVIVIIGICVIPIIKLVILMSTYYICASICEPIADKKIVELISSMGDTFKILLAVVCCIAVLLIISVTLIMKISNTGLMFR